MDALNKFVFETLKCDWVLEYAAILFLAAIFLLLVLIVSWIVAGVRGSKKKKQINELKSRNNDAQAAPSAEDEDRLREEIRAELEVKIRDRLEPQIREEVELEYMQKSANDSDSDVAAEFDKLTQTISQKNDRIAELEAELESKDKRIAELNSTVSETNRRVDSMSGSIAQSHTTVNDLNREIKSLRAEIDRLNARGGATAKAQKEEPVVKVTTAKKTPAKAAPAVDDDDEDEYDNEYGDETSAVKVTLKFDRVKNNWVISRSDTDRAYRRVVTKQEATLIAKDLAKRLHAQLVVHKKDGKFQKI